MDNVILSVAIPTYQRYKYLRGCLQTLITIPSNNVEFVVCDNTADNSEIIPFIAGLNDDRIKYFHHVEHLGERGNCDMAVSHTVGDYVCLIGDDDTICENMIKAAELCKCNGIEACCFPFPGFNWPDMTFEAGKEPEPNLFFKYEATGKYHYFDSRRELKKVLSHGGGLELTLPRLYHGMIARSCFERIKEKTGFYSPGPSPDMANAVASSLESHKTIFLSDYLMVSGYGKASARGEGNRKEHFGKIEDKPWLPKDVLEKWEKDIPLIFSAETIIAQSAIQSLRTMGSLKQYKYDYPTLYAEFYFRHKDVKKEYVKFLKESPKRLFLFFIGVLKKIKKSIVYRLTKPKKYLKVYNDVGSLLEAKSITESLSFKGVYTKE